MTQDEMRNRTKVMMAMLQQQPAPGVYLQGPPQPPIPGLGVLAPPAPMPVLSGMGMGDRMPAIPPVSVDRFGNPLLTDERMKQLIYGMPK